MSVWHAEAPGSSRQTMLANVFFAAFVGGLFARSVVLPLGVVLLASVVLGPPYGAALTGPGGLAVVLGVAGAVATTLVAQTPRLLDALVFPEHQDAPRAVVPEVVLAAPALVVLGVQVASTGGSPRGTASALVAAVALVVALRLVLAQVRHSAARYGALQNLKFLGLGALLAGVPVLVARGVLGAVLAARWHPLALLVLVLPPLHYVFHALATGTGDLPGRLLQRTAAADLTLLLLTVQAASLLVEFVVGVVVGSAADGDGVRLVAFAGIGALTATVLGLYVRQRQQARRTPD